MSNSHSSRSLKLIQGNRTESTSESEVASAAKRDRSHLRLVLPTPAKFILSVGQLELLEEAYIGIKTLLRAADTCLIAQNEYGGLEVFRSSGIFVNRPSEIPADHPLILEALNENGACVYPAETFADVPCSLS